MATECGVKKRRVVVFYPDLAVYGLICWWLDELEKAGIKETDKITRFHVGVLNQSLDRLMKDAQFAQWRDDIEIEWLHGALPLDFYAAKWTPRERDECPVRGT